MATLSRREFLKWSAVAGGGLALGDWAMLDRSLALNGDSGKTDSIKIGIIDPSSSHDLHGATVALDLYNKRGGVLGRQVTLIEMDDASNPQTAVKSATKLIREDRVDFLMGTFNGDVALAVAAVAQQENKLFMVTGAHIPELTGSRCNSHTFVF